MKNTQNESQTTEYEMRLKRLAEIKKAGVNPYPAKFDKQNLVVEIKKEKDGVKLKTAGRLITIRSMGKLIFCHLQDDSGQAQVVIKKDEVGDDLFKFFSKYVDMGDFIGVSGEVFTTHKGEKTLLVKDFSFLGKALLPLPEKWHGLKDEEIKYRQRYLDLISSEETKKRFEFRSHFIRKVREFYWQQNFKEVETPTFLHSATGATAKPYKTYNNALDIDVFLRISHELPLKELIVGGFEKIFELGKAFRNEGFDPSHLPEHTHLEHYVAYWDFEDNILFTEKMFDFLFKELGLAVKMKIINREGKDQEVDWQTPWQRIDFVEMLKKDTGLDVMAYGDVAKLLKDIKTKKIEFDGMDEMSLAGLVDNLYKKVCRPKIIDPVVLYNYPKYLQPLARVNDQDERIVDQFQLVACGWEIVKAYSELVDPLDQEARFKEQKQAKQAGAEEVMEGDDEYIVAMKHGMPPISGWGMGIDRVVALLSGQMNLRDVVLFPLLKPKNNNEV